MGNAGDFSSRVDLGEVGRLLEPGRVELRDLVAHHDGLGDAEAAVTFDHDLDVGTDHISHRTDVDREMAVLMGHDAPGRAEWIELEGLVALSTTFFAFSANISVVRSP